MEIKIPIVIDDKALEEATDKRIAELKQEGDFVLVTRCKDCKFARKTVDGDYSCLVDHRIAHNEDDFCSYAELKEIDGDKK